MVTEDTEVGNEQGAKELSLSCPLCASPVVKSSNHPFPERQKHLSPRTTIWSLSRDQIPLPDSLAEL